ncbi:MAG TPA: hypothetical protein VGI10_27030 [Polyangiaceae bacterium]|jgi:hypothetical protein
MKLKSVFSSAALGCLALACTSQEVTPTQKLPPPDTSGGCTLLPSAPLPATTWQARPNPELAPSGGAYAWKNVVILGGGFVSGVIFGPTGTLFARTDVGGAYRWDDGPSGVSDGHWVPLLDWINSNYIGVESIAPDPSDPNTVYLAVGTYSSYSGEILSSNDQGNTFTEHPMTIGMGGNEVGRSVGERLAVDPNLPSTLYFASRNNGLWTSTDSANSWTQVSSFPALNDAPAGLTLTLFDARSGSAGSASQTLYVGAATTTQPSLYRSTDAGVTWAAVPNQPSGFMPQHAAFDQNGVMYVAYANSPGPSGTNGTRTAPGVAITDGAVYKYDPNGDLWTDITPLHPNGDSDKFGYGGLALDPQHPGSLVVTTIDYWRPDQLYRSTDGATFAQLSNRALDVAGAQYLYWHKSANGPTNGGTGWMGSVAIDPTNADRAVYVTGQGVWWTDDLTAADRGQATHWVFRDTGLEETVALALASPPSGVPLISGVGDIAGFAHDDLDAPPAGGQFDTPIFGNTVSLDFAQNKPSIVVRSGTLSGGCGHGAYSLDGAKSWQPFPSEPKGSNGQGSVAVSTDGDTFAWAPKAASGGAATFLAFNYSLDHGASWVASDGIFAGSSGSLASDRGDAQTFYALVTAPRSSDPNAPAPTPTLYVSHDGAQTFSATANTFPDSPSLHPSYAQAGDVWIANSDGLHHSTDFGATFSYIGSTSSVADLSFGKPQTDGGYPALYLSGTAGKLSGILRSDDAGATFTRIDDDAHRFGYVNHLVGDPRVYGRVYLGTGGRGIVYGDLR